MIESSFSFKSESIVDRVLKGIGSSAINQTLLFFQAVILVPFFLKAWGADGYGNWLTLTAFISQMALLDLGGQNYIGNILAMSFAGSKTEEFRQQLSEGVSLFLIIGLGSLLFLTLCLVLFLYMSIPGLGRTLSTSEALIIGFLGTELLLLKIPGGIYVTAYRATGLFARGAMVGNIGRTVGMIAFLILLIIKVSPVVYAGATFIVGLLLTLIIVIDSRRKIPACRGIHISFRVAKDGVKHLSGALYFWFLALANTIKQHGIILVLAYFTTPLVVAVFSTHRVLANIPRYIHLLLQGSLWPELTFLWAQKRHSELWRITFFNIKAVIILTAFIAMAIWLSAPLIYTMWTGNQLEMNSTLLFVLLIHGVIFAGSAALTWSMLAANHHRGITLWSVLNSALVITLSGLLVKGRGANGVALALLIGDILLFFIVYPLLISSFLKMSLRVIYSHIAYAGCAIAIIIFAGLTIDIYFKGWWAVSVYIFAGALLALPAIRLTVGKDDMNRGIQLVKSVLSIGSGSDAK